MRVKGSKRPLTNENRDREKLELMVMSPEEWKEHYRKGELSEKKINVRANIYLLTLYVLPHMNPDYKDWGGNTTGRSLADCIHPGSEAWVYTMAETGNLVEDPNKKRQCMKSKEVVKKYIENLNWLINLRKDPAKKHEMAMWDHEIMRVAKRIEGNKTEERKSALKRKDEERMKQMSEDERKAYLADKEAKKRKSEEKTQELIIPDVDDTPLYVENHDPNAHMSDLSGSAHTVPASATAAAAATVAEAASRMRAGQYDTL